MLSFLSFFSPFFLMNNTLGFCFDWVGPFNVIEDSLSSFIVNFWVKKRKARKVYVRKCLCMSTHIESIPLGLVSNTFLWVAAPDLGSEDVYGVWRIDDTDHSFSTQPFRIKYARQDILLSMMVSFNLSLSKHEVISLGLSPLT